MLGISERHFRTVAVVEDDQLDALAIGRSLQARQHLSREGRALALRGIADPVPLAASDLRREAIPGRVDLLDQPDVVERVQKAEGKPLAETGSLDDVTQPERFARRLKGPEHLIGVHDRLTM